MSTLTVSIINPSGKTLQAPIGVPANGVILASAPNLFDFAISNEFANIASISGNKFISAKFSGRQFSLNFAFTGRGHNQDSARENLRRFFSELGEFRIMHTFSNGLISCYLDEFAVDPFTSDVVKATATFTTASSLSVSTHEKQSFFSGSLGSFKFPFASTDRFALSTRLSRLLTQAFNAGATSVNLGLHIKINASASFIGLLNVQTGEHWEVLTSFLPGDTIDLNTNDDEIRLTLTRNQLKQDISQFVSAESTNFFPIEVGENSIYLEGVSTSDDVDGYVFWREEVVG